VRREIMMWCLSLSDCQGIEFVSCSGDLSGRDMQGLHPCDHFDGNLAASAEDQGCDGDKRPAGLMESYS